MTARILRLGLLSGFIATIIMDTSMVAVLILLRMPVGVFFSFIGESVAAFLDRLGIAVIGDVGLGVILHYLIGFVLGVVFVAIVERTPLRTATHMRVATAGIIYTEITSLLLLVPAAWILRLAGSELAQLFVLAFVFHAVWGIALAVSYYRRRSEGVFSATS